MEKFHYRTLEELQMRARELGIRLPFANTTEILAQPLRIRGRVLMNRLGTAPMEGADSLPDGSPSDYTLARYVNEAVGGSAVLWFEAISIVEEGRSGKTQLMLTRDNLENYKVFCEKIKEAGIKANGYAPYLIMQANHSGRYSNPDNRPAPIIAYRNPIYEKYRAADDSCIASDDYLRRLEEKFGEAALMAREAGFDAVDIKSCHGYLLAEQHSPFLEKHGSHHDAVKHTNASFGWGTKSGKEYLALEPRLKYISEKSYNEEMKKYTIRGKLFAVIGKNINNRMAVFNW